MLDNLLYTLRAIKERDPAARSYLEIILLYSGFHAVALHVPAHFLHKHRLYFLARCLSQVARFLTGVEIHPAAQIDKGLFIDHGMGVVIGETAVIGKNCTIYQGVTIGGTGKETGKRHPTLGEGVMVGSGARVLGPFQVGDHAKIAAGAVVIKEVPPFATAVGVPARVVRIGKKKLPAYTSDSLDQVDFPNPFDQELKRLQNRIQRLENQPANKKFPTPPPDKK